MKTQVNIVNENGQVILNAPYCAANNVKYKSAGGKWDGKAWSFKNTPAVYKIINDLFGADEQLVTVEIAAEDDRIERDTGIYTLGGYVVATRRFRDSAVNMPVGVELYNGEFAESGGSQKNPAVKASDDAVFRAVVRKDFAERNNLKVVSEEESSPFANLSDAEIASKIEALQAELERRK